MGETTAKAAKHLAFLEGSSSISMNETEHGYLDREWSKQLR